MNNILEKIIQISEIESISVSKIEALIGASKGVLHKAIQKNTDIGSKWVVLIAENFPQYNTDWLLTGRGEMLRGLDEKLPNKLEIQIQIERLKEENSDLKSKLISCYEKIGVEKSRTA